MARTERSSRSTNISHGRQLERTATIGNVMKRLEEYIPEPLAIFNTLDSKVIYDRLNQLENLDERTLISDRVLLLQRLESKKRYPDDQYSLLAHLFLSVRQTIPKGKFDERRENTNIDGVVSLLCGDTKEGKTGKGKSAVIAPTVLLFKALWLHNSSPQIFSPPNNTLLNEAILNYEKVRRAFLNGLPDQARYKIEEKTRFIRDKIGKTPEIKDVMDVLTGPKDRLMDAYYQKIPVIFSGHKTTVFSLPQGKEIEFNPPSVLFDEIHQLTDESFISTSRSGKRKVRVSPEILSGSEVEENISSFIIAKLVSRKLQGNKKNFYIEGNELNLSENAYQEMEQLNADLTRIFESGSQDQQLSALIDNYVLPGLTFNQSKKELIVKTIFEGTKKFWGDLLQEENLQIDEEVNPRLNYLETLAEKIVSVMSGIKPGQDYVTKKGGPSVRERGRGILLPSHQYNDDVDFFIRVVDDNQQYRFIPQGNRLNYGFSFPSWVNYYAKGKVQGLTANLFRQDLWTGEIKKGKLARVLEEFTSGKVTPAEEQKNEQLPLPNPEIFTDTDGLLNHFATQKDLLAGQNQQMIICYNDYLAENIQGAIEDKSIGLIISTTSEKEVKRLLGEFAKGNIKTIITSGRAGYGVDIKKSDGSFPNFHITIINPETQADISQGFGRLRAKKHTNNFSILLTEDFLNQLSTLFYEKQPLPLNFYHTTDEFQKIMTLYKNGQKQEEFNRLFYQLLDLSESMSVDDYIMKTKLELTFQTKIAPVVRGLKTILIKRMAEDIRSPIHNLLENYLLGSVDRKFIKKMLLEDLSNSLALPEEDLWLDFFDSAARIKLQNPTFSQNDSVLLNLIVNDWFENQIQKGSLQQYYEKLFQDSDFLRQEVPKKFLDSKVESYKKLAPLIASQLPFEQVYLSNVENVSIEAIPPFDAIKGELKPKTVSDPQKFIKIGENKYLVIFRDYKKNTQELLLWSGSRLPEKGTVVWFSPIDTTKLKQIFGRLTTKDQKGEISPDIFYVMPTITDTDQVVTHMVVVQYKKQG